MCGLTLIVGSLAHCVGTPVIPDKLKGLFESFSKQETSEVLLEAVIPLASAWPIHAGGSLVIPGSQQNSLVHSRPRPGQQACGFGPGGLRLVSTTCGAANPPNENSYFVSRWLSCCWGDLD